MDNIKKYRLEKLKSASNVDALIVLYDTIIEDVEQAKVLFAEIKEQEKINLCTVDEKKKEYVVIIAEIKKIIEGFANILDYSIEPVLASNLDSLYWYIYRRIMITEHCVRQCPDIFDELIKIFSNLRNAWQTVREKNNECQQQSFLTAQDSGFLNIKV